MSYTLTEAEERLAKLIWEKEPLPSSALVTLCEEAFDWKKSTTYTMLKRLEQKGVFQNKGSVVQALLSQEEWESQESRKMVADGFGGSLPRFLSAFTRGSRLAKEEVNRLRCWLDDQGG